MTAPIGSSTPLMNHGADYYASALTPDALMIYISTRLSAVDDQIQSIFKAQQNADKIRSSLNEIRTLLNTLPENADKNALLHGSEEVLRKVEDIITEQIGSVDEDLAARITHGLEQSGYALRGEESQYRTAQLERTRDYLDDLTSELESASQMNMIRLQSLMSARQTAVSLSTNLIGKLGESLQKVVENIR